MYGQLLIYVSHLTWLVAIELKRARIFQASSCFGIQTEDLWCHKRLFCHMRHKTYKHGPNLNTMFNSCPLPWKIIICFAQLNILSCAKSLTSAATYRPMELKFFLLNLCILSLLCLSCTAKLILWGKSVVLHLLKGPELKMHYWEDREEKKSPHSEGFELTISLLWGVRSTAVLQPLLLELYLIILIMSLHFECRNWSEEALCWARMSRCVLTSAILLH